MATMGDDVMEFLGQFDDLLDEVSMSLPANGCWQVEQCIGL